MSVFFFCPARDKKFGANNSLLSVVASFYRLLSFNDFSLKKKVFDHEKKDAAGGIWTKSLAKKRAINVSGSQRAQR